MNDANGFLQEEIEGLYKKLAALERQAFVLYGIRLAWSMQYVAGINADRWCRGNIPSCLQF